MEQGLHKNVRLSENEHCEEVFAQTKRLCFLFKDILNGNVFMLETGNPTEKFRGDMGSQYDRLSVIQPQKPL